jgi:serine/threonine protein kinase
MRQDKIGRYVVLETLASGGMGVVYKAKDPLIDRIVAIKTLGLGLSPIEAETFRTRFAREAQSAGRLNHPNIVTIHDMGESGDGGAYIAMEFLEGKTLRDILDSGVVLAPAAIADIVVQVADGLAFAHRNDVVHCDIKPANIMVLENGTVKIMDFGIARLPTGSRTFAGNVLGSPRYISPEQIVGRPVDARSDIFALGAVFYEALTGVPPFAGTAIDEILYQVINEKPIAPSLRNKSLPSSFDAIVERAMAKHPDDRYQHAEEVAVALRALDFGPQRMTALFPLKPALAAKPTSPGASTVQIEPPVAEQPLDYVAEPAAFDPPPAPVEPRRRVAWYGAAVAALVTVVAWSLWPSGSDDREPAAAEASRPTTIASTQPPPKAAPIATEPDTIPPLNLRNASPGRETGPAMESNTVAAPSMTAPTTAADAAASGVGRVGLAISPWGEVYVDGRMRGVTPPMTEIKLPPGTYTVEIRNTTFAPHRQTIEVGDGAPVRIRHKFR